MPTPLLIILLCLIIPLWLFVALLFLPMAFRLSIENGNVRACIRIFGIPIYRYPQKKKLCKYPYKHKQNAKKAAPQKASSSLQKAVSAIPKPNKTDPASFLDFAKELLSIITSFTPNIKTTLHRLQITPPAKEDAADAALLYTAVAGGTAALLEVLDQNTKLCIQSKDAIDLQPNYTNQKTSFHLELTLSFAPRHALAPIMRVMEELQKNQEET